MDNKKATKPAKEKRRNSDKRKEKSRDAARCRRSRETEIFSDLAGALPLSPGTISQLDKASIMRLAISYLRVRSLMHSVPPPVTAEKDSSNDQLFLRALEGFLLVISSEGDFVFISDNIQDYLGIPQIELMGQSIYEFSHPCDHEEIKEILSVKSPRPATLPCSFFVRLKSTITSKGRSVNIKSASYKVIHCTGHLVGGAAPPPCEEEPQRCLVAIGEPIPHPSNIEIPLDKQTFLSKHSLDMRFTYADDKIGDFLGFNCEELIGKSVYEYHHAMDGSALEKAFKTLLTKGQCETGRYRFLAKQGGYVWVLTQATLIYASKTHKPTSVVCVNFVISGIESKHEICSSVQLTPASTSSVAPPPAFYSWPKVVTSSLFAPAPPAPKAVTARLLRSAPVSPNAAPHPAPGTGPHSAPVSPLEPARSGPLRPQPATAKVFAPRTQDMNKGFLMFADDTGLTVLKDEPEDLTHLAPTAGDVCVPLENNPFMSDMFEDFMLGDGYCPLLSEDKSDPFFSYRDDAMGGSPQMLALSLDKGSDRCSLPSLCSPSLSLSVDTEGDEELSMRAPYIPMGEGDDLPLLVSADLMWGPLPPDPDQPKPTNTRGLEELLRGDSPQPSSTAVTQSAKCNDLVDPSDVLDQIYTRKCGEEEKLPGGPERGCKRPGATSPYPGAKRRVKEEPGGSQLLRHLIQAQGPPARARPRSDSVLMNLLVSGCDDDPVAVSLKRKLIPPDKERKRLFSLLEDLDQRDYDVNAPVGGCSHLLQGQDLLYALEASSAALVD